MGRDDVKKLVEGIGAAAEQAGGLTIMEVCGTHTVNLFRSGARSLLPGSVRLVSGPGCPVCVTSQSYIDMACDLALMPGVTVCTYGDMVRVPGDRGSLEKLRGEGAKVGIVYSARDALIYAQRNPEREVVFLAVGFETTTPPTAALILEAEREGVKNLSILPGHKLVIPAMEALLSGGEVPVDGFLCPGHVSIVIGASAYDPIASKYGKPCVVAGFELEGMLRAILFLARQIAAGEAMVENAYGVAVTDVGNLVARNLVDSVFTPGEAVWRAIGPIPGSGLDLLPAYENFDAGKRFGLTPGPDIAPKGCRCGEVILGKADPSECPLFGGRCTPREPVGPCMVSTEGTCAAWFKYNLHARNRTGERE